MTRSNVDSADLGKVPLSGQVVGIIVASLSISIITLIASLIFASTLLHSLASTQAQIISAPEIDRNNGIVTARMDARADKIRSAAVARSNLPPPRPLTPNEAANVVDVVQSQLSSQMSPAQVQALTTELRKADQKLIDPALPISKSRFALRGPPPFQIVLADTGGTGPGQSIRLETLRTYLSMDDREGVSMHIGLDGTVSRISETSAVQRAGIVRRGNNVVSISSFIPQWEIDERLYFRSAIAWAAEFIVAVVLLIAGITALRGNRQWPLYHRLFAWAQLSVLAAAALIWFTTKSGDPADANVPIVLFIIGGAYPAVLFFILPRRHSIKARKGAP